QDLRPEHAGLHHHEGNPFDCRGDRHHPVLSPSLTCLPPSHARACGRITVSARYTLRSFRHSRITSTSTLNWMCSETSSVPTCAGVIVGRFRQHSSAAQ